MKTSKSAMAADFGEPMLKMSAGNQQQKHSPPIAVDPIKK